MQERGEPVQGRKAETVDSSSTPVAKHMKLFPISASLFIKPFPCVSNFLKSRFFHPPHVFFFKTSSLLVFRQKKQKIREACVDSIRQVREPVQCGTCSTGTPWHDVDTYVDDLSFLTPWKRF